MEKKFNITGICRPTQHYMADISGKLSQTLRLVEYGEYFIINRPRQYGKTTMLFTLASTLQKREDYFVIRTSFEGVGDLSFENEQAFSKMFMRLLAKYVSISAPELNAFMETQISIAENIETLSDAITNIVKKTHKKVILLIDEVDKSSNNQLFVSFLAMLRSKYLERDDIPTFHSVVLAGVHDVKSLKLKLRPDEEQKYNSPWNIATDFKVDMNFSPSEINPMLDEYAKDNALNIDSQAVAEHIFYYTSGYPFLVSKLCKTFDEDILPKKTEKTFTKNDIEEAVKIVIKENNTNFESLTKNILDNPKLYHRVYQIAIDNETQAYYILDPILQLGVLYGIFTEKEGKIAIHNRIYNEVLLNFMAIEAYDTFFQTPKNAGYTYHNNDKSLNMEAVLRGFQAFMRKEYSKKDDNFLEKNGRLVFLAFIKPIINGSGYDFKEVQISEECRLDVVITYLQHKYIAELKIWYGEKAHQKGLKQLADYLTVQGLTEGYLIVFNKNAKKQWKAEWIEFEDKKIFMIWV